MYSHATVTFEFVSLFHCCLIVNPIPQKAEDNDFDTTIQGPWMKKWDIVHVNHHVEKLDATKDYATWHAHKA